jgi:hypothetical protein
MVRAYKKLQIESYRVEIEARHRWLRKHSVASVEELAVACEGLFSSHFCLVEID